VAVYEEKSLRGGREEGHLGTLGIQLVAIFEEKSEEGGREEGHLKLKLLKEANF